MMGRPVRPATCGQIPPSMQKGPSFPSPLASLDVCTSRGSPQLDQITGAAQQVKDRDMSELIEELRKQAAVCRDSNKIGLITKGRVAKAMDEAAATITALQAELAEAREVPGRIAEWLREKSDKQHDKGYGREASALSDASDAIEARDWSKP